MHGRPRTADGAILGTALAAAVCTLQPPPAATGPGTAATPAGVRTAARALLRDGFESPSYGSRPWADHTRHRNFHSRYDGYGSIRVRRVSSGHRLDVAPRVSARPGETHAGLVTSLRTFSSMEFAVSTRTVKQLRTGSSPNPWETAWVLWDYTDDRHFYSVVLKPTGWELGKEDPAYPGSQRYLRTGTRRFPIGHRYRIRVVHRSSTITVYVNGMRLTSYMDRERPYASGEVGLYTEDAKAQFDDVIVTAL